MRSRLMGMNSFSCREDELIGPIGVRTRPGS
jgi:hypothetical protein